jgi:hypothetical protein
MAKQSKALSVDLRVSVVASSVPNAGGFIGEAGTITGRDGKWWLVKLDGDPEEWAPIGFLSNELELA